MLGTVVAGALWWLYFDVVALVAERRLTNAAEGRERNAIARDSYSFLHLPMVAGIVLGALGLKKTLGHVDEQLEIVPATALFGGVALYYAGHVAFRLRSGGRLSTQRVVAVLAALALIPLATAVDALVALALAAALTSGLIAYELIRFREGLSRLRAAI